MKDINFENKRVLLRVDLNVPLENRKVTNDFRIRQSAPTIHKILNSGGSVILVTHIGRPKEGKEDPNLSTSILIPALERVLNIPIRFKKDWITGFEINKGEVVLCENVRFLKGETSNDLQLAKDMSNLCDIFINEAFSSSHRAHASNYGVAQNCKIKAPGPLFLTEIQALHKIIKKNESPSVAIIGGSKISTKTALIRNLSRKVDHLILGGGIANLIIKARGFRIGQSLFEETAFEETCRMIKDIDNIIFPVDVVCANEFSKMATGTVKSLNEIDENDIILDFGPKTLEKIESKIRSAKTILWNGPLGVFEFDNFAYGTRTMAELIAESSAFSVAGGGDTIASIEKFRVSDKISYISTAGGAFLEFLEGRKSPVISILEQN